MTEPKLEYEPSDDEQPVLDDDGKLHQSLLKIDGKRFRCSCGCNVFHQPDKTRPEVYQCNGCPNRYETEAA